MKTKLIPILLFFFFFCMFNSIAQINFTKINEDALWTVKEKKTIKNFGSYEEISINKKLIAEIYAAEIKQLKVSFKNNQGVNMEAVLFLNVMEPIKVKSNDKNYLTGILLPKMFSGSVKGINTKTNVVLTLAPGYLAMQAYLPDEKITIEKNPIGDADNFMLQHSTEISFKPKPYECGIGTNDFSQKKTNQISNTNKVHNVTASSDKCTYVFVDCSNSLYMNNGSNVQNTINYVYSIWNNLRTMYTNEQMNVKISEINIWQSTDPFNTSASTLIANKSFADYYMNNYFGHMALLLDWSNLNGGIAGGYGWAKALAPNVCGNYIANPNPDWNFGSYAYCNLNGFATFSNFPVPALDWQVEVCIHELGHLFSSEHTQSCNWPGGPIDNCVAREGTCTQMPPTPVDGGTIMSYCHLVPAIGINYNNGFGTLPGNKIRDFIVANNCVTNCTGCFSGITIGPIPNPGVYQFEVTNNITANDIINGNPLTIVKIDAGVQVKLVNGFRATKGAKVNIFIDGCGGNR